LASATPPLALGRFRKFRKFGPLAPARREEFVRIDLLALQRAVADALVEPLGQHVVRRREAR